MSRNKILVHLEAIIETKSILAASRKLYVSQPSLSQYVKRLENDYGIVIFDRTSNPWKLTAEGEKLLQAQRQIEAIERECRQYFADRKGLKTGEIVIGSTQYRTVTLLNPILSVFKSRYPGITVRIEEGTTLEAAQLAESGRVDCALVITQMVPNTLDQVPIYNETVLVGLPPMHPYVAQHKPGADGVYPKIQITELKDTPFIIMKQGQVFHNYFEHLCEKYQLNLPIALETQSILTVPALVGNGIGAALIPSTIVQDCERRRVALYSIGRDLPINEVSIAWKRDRYQSYATKGFIETAVEVSKTIRETGVSY